MGAHEYHGAPSRHGRKLSKLGPGIIDAKRLDELLHARCPGCSLCCPGCSADRYPDMYPDGAVHTCHYHDEGGEG